MRHTVTPMPAPRGGARRSLRQRIPLAASAPLAVTEGASDVLTARPSRGYLRAAAGHRPSAPVDQERSGDRRGGCGRSPRHRRRAGSRPARGRGLLPAGLRRLRDQRRPRRRGGSAASAQAFPAGGGRRARATRRRGSRRRADLRRGCGLRRGQPRAGRRGCRLRRAVAELCAALAPAALVRHRRGRRRLRPARPGRRRRRSRCAVALVRAGGQRGGHHGRGG